MKILTFIILFLIISSCANRNKTFWCGDHPCINIKERKAYFKENLIIEVRELNKKNKEEMSKIEKIIKQTRISEKKRTREEKKISKQIKAEERRKLEEEKELAKKMKLDEKKKINEAQKDC